ncbi:MAG: GNAT family N-acetyltransferase [Bryobacteraceae bacterium]|nr:GNAT family N-acetyltransferase [Bryobacteraceae bacterium]
MSVPDMSPSFDLLLESNQQAAGAWKEFARRSETGVIVEHDGVIAAFSGGPIPFFNAQFLPEPCRDATEFERRARAAAAYGKASGLPWIFFLCHEWAPENAIEIATGAGLSPMMPLTGMVATELAPPRRALPPMEIVSAAGDKRVQDQVFLLNAAAYGMPGEAMLAANTNGFFAEGMYSAVGYVDGTPVSTATTFAVEGVLYVALVATHPDHQGKGYAEAVMRESLRMASQATGLTRTVLHASDAGHPVYLRMGYRDTATFTVLVAG